jgi:hypothetical protein
MMNHGNSLAANKKYKPLFLTVIKPWQEVERRFKENRKLNLAGYFTLHLNLALFGIIFSG